MTRSPRFLDTNVLLCFLTRDDEEKAKQAYALLLRVERGEERVMTSHLVIFETVFTLQRWYRVPSDQIRDAILSIIEMAGIQLPDKDLYHEAFDVYIKRNISFADAYNAVYMLRNDVSEVYSWDKHFDRIDGVRRVIPGSDSE